MDENGLIHVYVPGLIKELPVDKLPKGQQELIEFSQALVRKVLEKQKVSWN